MFSKLPQRFTAPFGLLGDEAKLAFPSQPSGIAKLWQVRNISERDSYWEQYFILFDSASDVFSLITPHQIRRALLEAPENVATLVRVVCNRLSNLLTDHTFPSPTPTATSATVAAFASTIRKAGGGSSERNTTKEVLNCLRILQRFLPVIFDVQGESNAFEIELMWKSEEVDDLEEQESTGAAPQFVIDDDEDDDSDEDEADEDAPKTPAAPKPQAPKPAKPKKKLPSLGERLFNNLIDLMFCCGFTLSPKIQVDHHKVNYVIWEKGIGSTSDAAYASVYDSNKVEVLRLLLVILSRQIYVPPASLFTKPSLYTLHFIQKVPRRDVLTILCSLLNTAMNASESASEISIGSMAGKLPYNHLGLLSVLLDFQSGTAKDLGSQENGTSAPTMKTNAFRYFLMKLHRTQDFEFVLNGINGIMMQQMNSMNNLLPGARKPYPYVHETIIFFWKLLELNKKFQTYFLESDKCMELINMASVEPSRISSNPFQPNLRLARNSEILSRIPFRQRGTGLSQVADFLVHAIYSIVATTSGTLSSLYPALIIALSNSAPYLKNLSVTASARLIQLFTSFANPLFLLADEGHPRFALLHAGSLQLHLAKFTLASGLREIRRVQQAKEELANRGSPNSDSKGKRPMNEPEPADASAEKAKLLQNESWNRASSLEEAAHSSGSPTIGMEDESVYRALMSPSGEMSSPVSEKARGKMRERSRRSSDVDGLGLLGRNGSLEGLAASVGRNGFVATQEWVTSWQQGLPLDTVLVLISDLLSKVQELQNSRKVNSATAIRDFLSNISIKDALPPPSPIAARQFTWTDASIVWLTSLIWGEIYVRGMSPLGIWNGTNIKLFHVKHSQTQPRQITETVTNVVGGIGGFLRRTSDTNVAQARARLG
ncbi:high-temperature-induced dauer-formation protein-domain-containing protein [Ephemerocybe angulata]|uniref:High-temperature-induced dauer-formation protein-domain-containing protein n=1 Tax=Ephemerocybe angulata TaxID=980116 RepID=A0A8H6IIM6_9AGAR|nr:high-temperature-induced dauer-formation protein-domain-containing protein [Tulosesus angulatus]